MSYTLNGLTYVGDPPSKYPATALAQAAFLRRFTQAERIAIRGAAKVSAEIEDYMALLNAATYVDLADPATIIGVQQLEAAGLIRGPEYTTPPEPEVPAEPPAEPLPEPEPFVPTLIYAGRAVEILGAPVLESERP
jgi:hypothetical protein